MTSPSAIEVRDLRKQFGDVTALDGLEVPRPMQPPGGCELMGGSS